MSKVLFSVLNLLMWDTMDVNIDNEALLFEAIRTSNETVVELLIQNKVNVNGVSGQNTPLSLAAANSTFSIVKRLIQAGATVNSVEKNTIQPLRSAVESDRTEIVDVLLQNDAYVNIFDRGKTELHQAVLKRNTEIVALLLAAKADVSLPTQNKLRETPLHQAVSFMAYSEVLALDPSLHLQPELVDCLLSHGADVHAVDAHGATPLHRIVLREEYFASLMPENHGKAKPECQIVELLLKAKADVNAKDECLNTPLHLVALEGNQHILQILLNSGACVRQRNKNNQTPLVMATKRMPRACTETIYSLIEAGADIGSIEEQSSLFELCLWNRDVLLWEKLLKIGLVTRSEVIDWLNRIPDNMLRASIKASREMIEETTRSLSIPGKTPPECLRLLFYIFHHAKSFSKNTTFSKNLFRNILVKKGLFALENFEVKLEANFATGLLQEVLISNQFYLSQTVKTNDFLQRFPTEIRTLIGNFLYDIEAALSFVAVMAVRLKIDPTVDDRAIKQLIYLYEAFQNSANSDFIMMSIFLQKKGPSRI